MNAGEARPRTGLSQRLLSRAEEWIYRANERNHPVFRLYDLGNELWAAIAFRGFRRRAEALDVPLPGNDEVGRLRFLAHDDLEAFASLLARFDFRYLPPHALGRSTAARALRRRSYVPLGVFSGDELVGYLLLRCFFPRRVVLGIWTLRDHQNRGFTKAATRAAAEFTRAEGLPNYITVPVDNVYSLRVALRVGWRLLRTNRRFHVLVYP